MRTTAVIAFAVFAALVAPLPFLLAIHEKPKQLGPWDRTICGHEYRVELWPDGEIHHMHRQDCPCLEAGR